MIIAAPSYRGAVASAPRRTKATGFAALGPPPQVRPVDPAPVDRVGVLGAAKRRPGLRLRRRQRVRVDAPAGTAARQSGSPPPHSGSPPPRQRVRVDAPAGTAAALYTAKVGPSWGGRIRPPRAPRAASEGVGWPSAFGRSGPASQIPLVSHGLGATPRESHPLFRCV